MSFSPEIIDQIRNSVDIVELVREYVPTMKKAGRNWKASCPFHNEKTPSLMVSPEKGIFHCFGCHAGGDIFKFTMLIDNISWPESVQKLAKRCGIQVKEVSEDPLRATEKQKAYEILESTAEFYHKCLNTKDAAHVREYLKKRGVTEESIEKFKLGYAPRNMLVNAALKKGYTLENLIKAGVVTKTERGNTYEFMSERLVFPIFDTHGRVVAFGGRILKDEQPKYINTPETIIYSKSNNLYGLFQSLPHFRQKRDVIILEGYMDVLVTQQMGVNNTVAALGTSFTMQHSRLISRYAEKISLLFDADTAGNNAAWRAIDTFIESELPIQVVNLPDSLDPDEYILKYGKESFFKLIESGRTAIDFLVGHASLKYGKASPEAKVKVFSEIIPLLAKIKNEILKHEWIKHIAYKLSLSEEALRAEMDKSNKHTPASAKNQGAQIKDAGIIRSLEEEILQIIINNPDLKTAVKDICFCNERNNQVCSLLLKETSIPEIINTLKESDRAWFSELSMEEKIYTSPDQMLNNLLRDLKNFEIQAQRIKLEKEIVQMMDGQMPLDNNKMQLYQDLTKQLKGSAKVLF